jgi:signal transduction histidine kinase
VTAAPRARRVLRGAEVALAFVAGVASFALVAVALAVFESGLFAALFGAVCVAAVIAIARRWGVAYAVASALAALLAYDWFQFPPTHAEELPDSGSLANLVVYLAVAVLVGELAASATRRAARLADEQAALRRVATLVARGVPASEVFAAVAHEVCEVVGADTAHLGRLEPDGTSVAVGAWSRSGDHIAIGTRLSMDGQSVSALVARTGQPARLDSYDHASGPIADTIRGLGIRASVGCPITVDGRPWGLVAASSRVGPLPPDSEGRITAFTQLVATALANAEARAEVTRLADEQAALRRVATLVARESAPAEVFAAVAEEVARLLDVDDVLIERYEADGTVTLVAERSGPGFTVPALTGVRVEGSNVSAEVHRTGRPARVDDYASATGAAAAAARDVGIRSAVGCPIVVDGRLWGVTIVGTRRAEPLPPETELRIGEFTELVATSISNLEARSELAESRARVVAAADQERRRVVRDLHDGAQQRIVHTVITLKLARRALENGDEAALGHVSMALENAEHTNAELRELAHGILPSALTHGGLHAGVESLASRMPVPVDNDVVVGRLPAAVEATAYFVVAEALTNVAKHAQAAHAAVEAHVEEGTLCLRVRDDGVGGVRPDGSGIVGLRDRLAVLHGRLRVETLEDGGTLLDAAIPLGELDGDQ